MSRIKSCEWERISMPNGDGSTLALRHVLSFRYKNRQYRAYTPEEDCCSEEEADAVVIYRVGRGGELKNISGVDTYDAVFEEFCEHYEKAENEIAAMSSVKTLDYLSFARWKQFLYRLLSFFCAIPGWFVRTGKAIGYAIRSFFVKLGANLVEIWTTFREGTWKTRVSYLVMGFGALAHGQWVRGIAFMLLEGLFIFYMIFCGAYWLSKFGTLGTVVTHTEMIYIPELGEEVAQTIYGDNSFKILLYGLITIFLIIGLIYTWRLQVKHCRIYDKITASGKKVKSNKDDLASLFDNQFHKTVLALPVAGMVMFTILPIIFMILVAFTNYDFNHDGYVNLFTWVGLDNFNSIFMFGSTFSVAFGEILSWTLIWAFFATFSNYFLGMFVAMMICKKGIKIKKVWRTIFVMTIAVPQFISLLYISHLFDENGIVNGALMQWGWISSPIKFWGNGTLARIMVLVINVWVGIPYLMLITTGILMNIPDDLYEAARIGGSGTFQLFAKITLPYMLFVMGPYLLTSFVGNINNFNVIYLLSGGGPINYVWGDVGGYLAGDTTILITWLFGITTGTEANYKMASVIGILIFIVSCALSLIVFNVMQSEKRENSYS